MDFRLSEFKIQNARNYSESSDAASNLPRIFAWYMPCFLVGQGFKEESGPGAKSERFSVSSGMEKPFREGGSRKFAAETHRFSVGSVFLTMQGCRIAIFY